MTNGHPDGNGHYIRISVKALLTALTIFGGYIAATIWYAAKLDTDVKLNTEHRQKMDTLIPNFRYRVNTVVNDHERRLDAVEARRPPN